MMKESTEREGMNLFRDARILSAEDRHSRRRKRTRLVYDALDWIFFSSLLVMVFLAFRLFLGFIKPYILWF